MAQPLAAPSLPIRHILASLETLAAFGALKAQALVLDAVVWRVLQINKFRPSDGAESVRNGTSIVCAVPSPHPPFVQLQFLGLVVLGLQVVAHISEVGQLHPAGLNAAAPRHSVTLACPPHGSLDCLSGD